MKGLVIAPQPFFSYRGTPFSVYHRAKAMVELGEELDLLTYGEGLDVDIRGLRILRIPQFKILGKTKIGPSMPKLLYDVFIFIRMVGLLIRNNYDYVHAHEEAAFFARFLKPIFRYRLIYDMHSSLPEQLENFSFSQSKLLKKIFSVLERSALQASDVVVAVCPSLLDHVNRILGPNEKSILVENSIYEPVKIMSDQEAPDPPCEIAMSESRLREGSRLIVYAGTLEQYQGIDMLLESFRKLCEHSNNVYLLVVGGTPQQVGRYERHAKSLGITDNCDFAGQVSQELAIRCNEMATMVVSPRLTGTNTPLKIYGQLAGGVPIIATRIESHTQILTDDIAILVDPHAEDFAKGMQLVLDSPRQAKQIANNAQRHYEESYSRSVYVNKVEHVLEIVGRSSQQRCATL